MSGFGDFLGNKVLTARLARDIASGRFAHAYIIEGKEGCGKRTLAKLICSAISCTGGDIPCMKCIRCDKIARGQSPDVIEIEADKDRVQIGVDVIRRLREDAVYAPNDLPKKFYIIKKADTMNPQAQNALLKILEEPPDHVMFLLLCENADNLLATIRSRAPVLRIEGLPDDTVCDYLREKSADAKALFESSPDAFFAAVKLARGSLGMAISLTDEKKAEECLEYYRKAEKYIELLADRRNAASELAFYEYASKLTGVKQRDELSKIYLLLADAARDLINVKLTRAPAPIFYATPEKARSAADKFALGVLIRLTEIFTEAANALDRNVNVSLSMVHTASAAAGAGKTK